MTRFGKIVFALSFVALFLPFQKETFLAIVALAVMLIVLTNVTRPGRRYANRNVMELAFASALPMICYVVGSLQAVLPIASRS